MQKPIRQFDADELLAFLDYLGSEWPGVTIATALAKVFLWSWGRREEVACLTWRQLRVVGNEYHFESVGKRGVDKWFRLPEGLTPEQLLEERRVAVAPGEGFGAQGRGWARLSLATPDDRLDLGLERLRTALG